MRRDWRPSAIDTGSGPGSLCTPSVAPSHTLLTDKLPTREASDLLDHSKISQATDTYVGRKIISWNVADVGVCSRWPEK
jgi:hypothetical protein